MSGSINKNIVWAGLVAMMLAWMVWTVLFYNKPPLQDVLWEIHAIYTGTLLAYCIIRYTIPSVWVELFKVFIRTMFRVWLIIFITLAIGKQMERVGFILSITFIFGYFEALIDIDRWLISNKNISQFRLFRLTGNKHNHIFASIVVMGIIHICCAVIIRVFYLFY